ncbi:hypothetical protein [Massilia sp. GCM10023247]|uniref:hypothetical protein n=1 Tax=Massilia sp. GCM10023247 TaxID=3252643 RepID=UPI003606A718
MTEAAALLGAMSMCVFWTAWKEKKNENPRDSRFMTVAAVVMMAGAGAFGLAAL